MDLPKISLLVLTLSFVIFCNATRRSLSGHHITDRSGDPIPINSDCICLPKVENSHPVLELIDTSGSNPDRLVVYLYIDAKTQKITAYTPNVERQQVFPDLSFEAGDDLIPLLPNESVDSLIKLSQNKISGSSIFGQDLNIDVSVPHQIINVPSEITVGETDSINIAHSVPSIVDANKILSPENNAEVHINSNGNVEVIDNLNLGTSDVNNIIQHLLPVHNSIQGIQGQMPLNAVPDGWQTNALNSIYKWDDNTINNIYDHAVDDSQNIDGARFLKFDQWFQQQMDSAMNKYSQTDVKYPDDAVLKSLVYKYLLQNGIFIMDEGIMKTPEGQAVNLSNLKLEPIVIGLSLGYNYPLSGVPSKIVRPSYDAMVLSMDHPYKILGIIPISQDYNPDLMGYTTMHLKKLIPSMAYSGLRTQCLNNKCLSSLPENLSFRSGKHQKKVISRNAQVSHDRAAQEPVTHEVHMKIYHSPSNPLINVKHIENSHSQKSSKGIPILNNVLNNIYKLLISDQSSRGGDKEKPNYDVAPIEEEGPDFRIVGGSAATGSGTPVSSRGRSAFQ